MHVFEGLPVALNSLVVEGLGTTNEALNTIEEEK